MKQLLNSLLNFIEALSLNDIIFFSAVVALIVLAVTMIYLVKSSRDYNAEEAYGDFQEDDLLGLAGDDTSDILPRATDEPEKLVDLAMLTKILKEQKSETIDLNKYEEDQEEKAIISYEELLEHTGNFKLNYKEEENNGILVKTVDLDNLATIDSSMETSRNLDISDIQLFDYAKEEAFLKALKDMKRMLS